jgi:WD40 repeat protein
MNLTKHWAAVLDDYVIDLAWSPDGTQLAAASASGPVSIFQGATGTKLHELPGHDNGTNCLAWRPSVTPTPAASSSDTPASHSSPLTSSFTLATGGQDGSVKLWDTLAGQHTATANLGTAWVEHLAWRPVPASATPPSGSDIPASPFTPHSSTLAAAAGRDLTFLNADASIRHRFKSAPKTLSSIAWHPQGGALAAAYFGGVCLWDADDFIAQKEFAYANGIHALAWSSDGRWLVSGNQDPSVHLWLPEEDQEFHMSGYEGKVKELSFDRTGRWLATGGGRDACIWDCLGAGPEGREPAMLPHDAKVCAVAFQKKFGVLATASQDGTLMLWSPERKQPLRATIKMPAAATKIAWSPDDAYLAIGSEKGAVYVLKCEA